MQCWPCIDLCTRPQLAVTNLAQGLVFATWGFVFFAAVGVAITYNMQAITAPCACWATAPPLPPVCPVMCCGNTRKITSLS